MGYETEIFLVDQGHGDFFSKWYDKETWCHAERQWRDLPDDALVSDGGVVIGSLKLCKIGRDGEYNGALTLPGLFDRNREQQRKEKKFVALRWFWHGPDQEEEWAELRDPYNDPLAIHDARETLTALDNSIKQNKEEEDWVYRRYTIFRAMLVSFIEAFPETGVVVSRGY